MQTIAAENNLSETAFLVRAGTANELERPTSLYGLDLKELCVDQSGKSLEKLQRQLVGE